MRSCSGHSEGSHESAQSLLVQMTVNANPAAQIDPKRSYNADCFRDIFWRKSASQIDRHR